MDLNKKRTKTVDRVDPVDLAEVSPESIPVYPFPDEVLEPVLSPIKSHKDCSFVSLVCKDWYNAERWSRRHVFIGNYYSLPPKNVARRIPKIRSVTLKGKPRFSDFNLVPEDWGADVHPWLSVLAKAYPFLEELRLKRMAVVNSSIFALSNTLITSNTSTSRNSNYFDTQEMLRVSSGNEMLMSSITGMPLMDSKHEAASAYVDATHSYKKTSTKACIANLEQALNIFMEIGRLSMAARYCKEIAELYEQEQNLEQAIAYYNKAFDLFQGEEVTTSANQCKQKIAQFSAQLEQYQKAIFLVVSFSVLQTNCSYLEMLQSVINGGTGTGNHENDAWAVGSPGGFRWEGFQGSFSLVTAVKRMSQKKEYEVALVGAFRREKDKDLTLQAVTAESQAAMKLAKQREDEIQGLKLRLRFREAAVKRLEGVDKVREVEGNPDFSNKDVG
uniref:F-box domain-containing protein n=1 Tax=Lactuca sativa TaxID=4236 RepID=A0A9R1XJW6_LACSA|nr:hypothetical protein LSAT_V11C400224870 [Lactuca sativa]